MRQECQANGQYFSPRVLWTRHRAAGTHPRQEAPAGVSMNMGDDDDNDFERL